MKDDCIYTLAGWLDVPKILSFKQNNIFLVGARGVGKTYGILEYCVLNKLRFAYIRRTQKQADLCKGKRGNPFKTLNNDHNWNIIADTEDDITCFFESEENEKGKRVPVGEQLGYLFSLSTFANMRSVDLSDIDIIFYDEFIKQLDERPLRNEATAFLNMCETIGRNKELATGKALKVICAANSNSLDNDIFYYLRLVTVGEKMKRKGIMCHIDNDRDLRLYILKDSPISEKKKETSLYKLAKGTDFEDMAINNDFVDDDTSLVKQLPLKEFRPIVSVGEVCIYRHKFDRRFYVTTHFSGSPEHYNVTDRDLKRFRKNYSYLWDAYFLEDDTINFETYGCQSAYLRYLKNKKF